MDGFKNDSQLVKSAFISSSSIYMPQSNSNRSKSESPSKLKKDSIISSNGSICKETINEKQEDALSNQLLDEEELNQNKLKQSTMSNDRIDKSIKSKKRLHKQTDSIDAFKDINISEELQNVLKKELEIESPTAIQKAILPELLENQNKNFYIKSTPHSGKKIAYLIAALERTKPNLNKVQTVILSPSRELASYVCNLIRSVALSKNIIVDYSAEDDNISNLKGHIIFSTMDAFEKFLNSRETLPDLDCLIIDEIDLMFSESHRIPQFRRVMNLLKDRINQVQIYSTTISGFSLQIASECITRHLIVLNLLSMDILKNYLQFYFHSNSLGHKYRSLKKTLLNVVLDKVVIFTQTESKAKYVQNSLVADKFSNVILLTQKFSVKQRLINISNFNTLKKAILVTHYPMTHGFRLLNVRMLINYDVTQKEKAFECQYFHRIMQLIAEDEKPNFVVNIFDDISSHIKPELERKFGKMLRLEVDGHQTRKHRLSD